jgi:hypothetical protein
MSDPITFLSAQNTDDMNLMLALSQIIGSYFHDFKFLLTLTFSQLCGQ